MKSYLTIAYRNLWKNKAHTLINVLGLALGIASSIVIYFIVSFELSYDNFHEKAGRIYRITSTFEREGKTYYNNGVPVPLPEAFRQDFAENTEEVLIVEQTGGRVILDGETTFINERKIFTENAYFSFFDFPLVAGNPKTVLQQPNEVVLSQSLYQKLFNSEEYELGKTFSFTTDTTYLLKVTGILTDLPKNTDLQFEFLVSYSTKPENTNASWESYFSKFNAFVLLPEEVKPAAMSSQFQEFLKKYRNVKDVEKYK